MNIGDKPAFACAAENGHQPGMTYREWLVDQILSGLAEPGFFQNLNYAAHAIKLADEVISQLEHEEVGLNEI